MSLWRIKMRRAGAQIRILVTHGDLEVINQTLPFNTGDEVEFTLDCCPAETAEEIARRATLKPVGASS